MLAQLYRSKLLNEEREYRGIWENIAKARFPFRVELRLFAEWLGTKDGSVEQFMAEIFAKDAGGGNITVESLHTVVENQPVLLIFDGLDEVGSDDLRDVVISKISECVERFEVNLKADLRVVLTTRPPAIAGRIDKLAGFAKAQILPLSESKVVDFVRRWTAVQCDDPYEREHVSDSFRKRRTERHVSALVKNPMQLSVLLHFIRLKGEAFPDRRAELYREYFKTVIDRDVEKSPRLRQHRDDIEALHEVIGFEIHSRAESDAAAASLSHKDLIQIVRSWLAAQGRKTELANALFRLGEERLGLIMVLKGEGAEARYGFDVQPVREYFAAAFINDKCERNAHDLFQLMVPRSFWHEVALFLAGLRRANEKADLLFRAKSLDNDPASGWRSYGRATVIQLLQEGVLTTPGHVHQEAISFLLEGLDPSDRTVRSEPEGLVPSLPDLITSCDSHQPRKAVTALLSKALQTEDRHGISRVCWVANRVVPYQDLETPLMAYTSRRKELAPLLKLLWPANAGVDFAGALENEQSLLGPPRSDWAQYWFQAALVQPSLTGLNSTANYHEFLIEQFAFQPPFRNRYTERESHFQANKPYAIWRLCENIRLLGLWLTARAQDITAPAGEVDFSGLTDSTRAYLKPLIEASTAAIERISEHETLSGSFRELLVTINSMLGQDGLTAWVGCRCAVSLMLYSEGIQASISEDGRRYYTAHRPSKLAHIPEWRELRRNLTPLFRAAIPYDLDRQGKTLAARILQYNLHRSCPSHVRVDGKLESVPLIIAGRWRQRSPETDWLDRTPFPIYWTSELMGADRTLGSLALLANRSVGWYGPSVSLNMAEMKQLLELVEGSDDASFVAGAFYACLETKCWNIASLRTLGKMLIADADFADIGFRLFPPSRGSEAAPVRIRQLAQAIIRGKIRTSPSTSTAAANFLSANTVLKLPSLRSTGAFAASTTEACSI